MLKKKPLIFAFLATMTVLAVLPDLGGLDMFYGDEVFYIGWSDSLLHSSNRAVRVHDGHLHFHKPPLYNWLVAMSYYIFGVSLYAARLPSVAAAAIIVCLTFWFTQRRFGEERTSLVAALAVLSSYIFYQHARLAISDMVMSLGVAIAAMFWLEAALSREKRRAFLFVASLGVGLAGAVKGHVGIVVSLLPLVGFTLLDRSRDRIRIREIVHPLTWLPAAVMSLGWYAYVLSADMPARAIAPLHPYPDQSVSEAFLEYFKTKEVQERPAGGVLAILRNVFFYPTAFVRIFFPWSLFVIAGIFFGKRRLTLEARRRPREYLMLASLIVPLLLFFTFVIGQQTRLRYLLPATPAVAILAARFLSLRLQSGFTLRFRPEAIAVCLLMAYNVVLIGLIPGNGEPVEELCEYLKPALTPDDTVLFAGFHTDWHTYGRAILDHATTVEIGNGNELPEKLEKAISEGSGDTFMVAPKEVWENLPADLKPSLVVVKEIDQVIMPKHGKEYRSLLSEGLPTKRYVLAKKEA